MTPTRPDLLADLADAVRQLTEPRHHTEYLQRTESDTVTSRKGRTRTRRRNVRRPHTVTLPGLLEALRQAAVPGSNTEGGGNGGGGGGGSGAFESRPPADLEPIAVLREITHDVTTWARALGVVDRRTVVGQLWGLVGAQHSDQQLANLAADARRWVKRARLATGFDPAPVTLNVPCPYCEKRYGITITGDMQAARCGRCGTEWTPDTIGLLADMLRANQTQETAAAVRCWMPDCTAVGPHVVHQDGAGRTWRDTCTVPVLPTVKESR